MKTKLSLSQITGLSCMIFAIFFGAGNMIFPPALAQQAGSNSWIALAGFVLSDVGIAIGGIMAVVLAGSSLFQLASRINKKFAHVFSLMVYCSIGPLFALPRTGSVSFEIGMIPFLNGFDPTIASLIFTFIFFLVTYVLCLYPGKIVDVVGKILTPLLIVCILALFVGSLMNPLGPIALPQGDYQTIPFFKGMVEGYLALDGFAGLVFAILVIEALKGFGITEKKAVFKATLLCSVIAGVILTLIYAALVVVGVQTSSMDLFSNGGTLLNYVTSALFGTSGHIILAGAVVLACLTTSIGLSCSFADYIEKSYPKYSYKSVLAIICIFSFVIANVGLTQLITLILPLLVMMYPLVIVLVLVSLLDPWLKDHTEIMKMGMLFAFPLAFIDGLKTAGIMIPYLSELAMKFPFFNVGIGWFLPGLVGCFLGYFMKSKKRITISNQKG